MSLHPIFQHHDPHGHGEDTAGYAGGSAGSGALPGRPQNPVEDHQGRRLPADLPLPHPQAGVRRAHDWDPGVLPRARGRRYVPPLREWREMLTGLDWVFFCLCSYLSCRLLTPFRGRVS